MLLALLPLSACIGDWGPVYEKNLAGPYAVWAVDATERASIVAKDDRWGGADQVVGPMVFAYGWNKDFIIAKQHPTDEWFHPNPLVTNWYIVAVQSGTVYGPLSEQAFAETRARLAVAPDLTFSCRVDVPRPDQEKQCDVVSTYRGPGRRLRGAVVDDRSRGPGCAMEELVKVAIRLEQGLPDNELLWAEPVDGDLYRLRNIPFCAKGYADGDIVRCARGQETITVIGMAEDSGNGTIRIVFADGEGREAQQILAELVSVGCTYERATADLVAVTIPPTLEIPFSQLANYLNDIPESILQGWDIGKRFTRQAR
jgi:hypothetical protein